MEVAEKIRESLGAINDLVEMGLLDQAEQLLQNSLGEWGRHTELMRLKELIDTRRRGDSQPEESGGKYCPVCGNWVNEFSPLPEYYIQNMLRYRFKHIGRGEMTSIDEYSCPDCGASDRERLYSYWIEHEAQQGRFSNYVKMLHFAPEEALAKKLRTMNIFREYKTADMSMPNVDYTVDITSLPFENESVDFFICSHILEHVPDDRLAISELYRITRGGGRGLLMVPVVTGIMDSVEGTPEMNNSERWKFFGQDDHVRLYAHDDFVGKVVKSGFHLMELGIDYFGKNTFQALGLLETSVLYVVEKW